jgi:hypothetical protein
MVELREALVEGEVDAAHGDLPAFLVVRLPDVPEQMVVG